jgi:hypothetical protein
MESSDVTRWRGAPVCTKRNDELVGASVGSSVGSADGAIVGSAPAPQRWKYAQQTSE